MPAPVVPCRRQPSRRARQEAGRLSQECGCPALSRQCRQRMKDEAGQGGARSSRRRRIAAQPVLPRRPAAHADTRPRAPHTLCTACTTFSGCTMVAASSS